jgi:hypothetical protein
MARRARHPKKEVEAVLVLAEAEGWIVRPKDSGHSWGSMACPGGADGCRIQPIWSTPKNPGNFAKKLRRAIQHCPHSHPSHD